MQTRGWFAPLLARFDCIHYPLCRQQPHLLQRLTDRRNSRSCHFCPAIRRQIPKLSSPAARAHRRPATRERHRAPVKSSNANTAVNARPLASSRLAQSSPPSKPDVGSTKFGNWKTSRGSIFKPTACASLCTPAQRTARCQTFLQVHESLRSFCGPVHTNDAWPALRPFRCPQELN